MLKDIFKYLLKTVIFELFSKCERNMSDLWGKEYFLHIIEEKMLFKDYKNRENIFLKNYIYGKPFKGFHSFDINGRIY